MKRVTAKRHAIKCTAQMGSFKFPGIENFSNSPQLPAHMFQSFCVEDKIDTLASKAKIYQGRRARVDRSYADTYNSFPVYIHIFLSLFLSFYLSFSLSLCIDIRVCVNMHTWIYIYIYRDLKLCRLQFPHSPIYTCIYIHIHTYTYIHMCVYMYILKYIHVYIYMYI